MKSNGLERLLKPRSQPCGDTQNRRSSSGDAGCCGVSATIDMSCALTFSETRRCLRRWKQQGAVPDEASRSARTTSCLSGSSRALEWTHDDTWWLVVGSGLGKLGFRFFMPILHVMLLYDGVVIVRPNCLMQIDAVVRFGKNDNKFKLNFSDPNWNFLFARRSRS